MTGGSVKLFQFNNKYGQTIGIKLPESNQNRFTLNSKNLIVIICLVPFGMASGAFLLYDAKSMQEYGATFYALSCIIEALAAYFITKWKLREIFEFTENCETFIGKRDTKTLAYKKMNEKIEQISEWFYLALLGTILWMALFPLLYTYASYFILDSGVESFYLYPPTEWPFDWKTPGGYFLAWFVESIGVTVEMLVFIPFLSYLLGSCWLFIFVADDITTDLIVFNVDVMTQQTDNAENAEFRTKRMNEFCTIIQLCNGSKQCVEEFNGIYKYSLFVFYVWSILFLSSTLVATQFTLWEDDWNTLEMSTTAMTVFWAIAYNFVACELGHWVTNQYEVFGDELEACIWHLLPIEMQRMYLIFLMDTQQPIFIKSYGGIVCSRETFKKISHKAFSYFMTLRQIR